MTTGAEQPYYTARLVAAKMFALLCLAALLARLWYLQGIRGSFYRDLSENNRIRRIRTEAPRGNIFDREGRVLVRNRPALNVALMRGDVPDVPEAIKRLAEITGREEDKLVAQYESGKKSRPFEPKAVMFDISRSELARVEVNGYRLPGVIITHKPTRAYPNNALAAQLLGYTREISKSQFEVLRNSGYWLGDSIGQSGLEKRFEETLRGRPGYIEVEVDARGNRRDELGIEDDRPGSDLQLTIDLDIQRAAEEALGGRKGSVVAVDPRNGEILALVSSPSFDANVFSGHMLAEQWERLANDPDKPLTNRAISSVYPPGSTIKLLWALAGLAEGKVTPNSPSYCPGYVKFWRRKYHCHKRTGHGQVNLEEAVTMSCNAYFYNLGQALGIDGMAKYMEMFRFGQKTGIDLPGEEVGTRPSKEWKLERYGERWYPGDTVPISIGQGYVVVTPLQLASVVAAVANGGKIFRPMLVKKIFSPQRSAVQEFAPTMIRAVPVAQKIFEKVRGYAVEVVNHKKGTGWRAKLEPVLVGGKTGTAQVGALGKEALGDRFKDHAWFVAFAPADNPTIALAAIVENSGHGGRFAAPVAKTVLEAYFRKLGMIPIEEDPETEEEGDHGNPSA